MTPQTPQTLADLLGGAATGGEITQASLAIFTIPDMGRNIQAGLGSSVDNIDSTEVVVFARLIDDSGSISQAYDKTLGHSVDHTDIMIEGTNMVVNAVLGSKQAADILVLTSYLCGGVQEGFTPIKDAMQLNRSNYSARGSHTPLRRGLMTMLGTVAAKVQELSYAGVPARSVTLVITDGDEYGDPIRPQISAADVKAVVDQMRGSEKHIVLFMGIDDGRTSFKRVAMEMGIPENCVRTPGNTESEIRAEFGVVSQSFVRASQVGGAGFSQTAQGGFAS